MGRFVATDDQETTSPSHLGHPWTMIGLVALDNRIGHDGTVWGEDFVLSDLSAFASKELGAI